MAVQVSGDLNVQVLQDVNINKLAERQQALQVAIQRGEPKSLGVSVRSHETQPENSMESSKKNHNTSKKTVVYKLEPLNEKHLHFCLLCLYLNTKMYMYIHIFRAKVIHPSHWKTYLTFCCYFQGTNKIKYSTSDSLLKHYWSPQAKRVLSQAFFLLLLLMSYDVLWFFQQVVASRFIFEIAESSGWRPKKPKKKTKKI